MANKETKCLPFMLRDREWIGDVIIEWGQKSPRTQSCGDGQK